MGTPEGKVGIHILSVLAEGPGEWVKWTGADGMRSARLAGANAGRLDGEKALILLVREGLIKKKVEGRTTWLKRLST